MSVQYRTVPQVTVDMPTPVVIAGRPMVPDYWATCAVSGTATVGPSGIHATPAPKPIVVRSGGGYLFGGGDWAARWSVDTLPDPAAYSGSMGAGTGTYWLGDPTWQDGTAGIASGARQWAPDGAVRGVPSWRSTFPFKPLVSPLDRYLSGGRSVHHPRSVIFHPYYIEHMWLDWGAPGRQPFTWLIYAMMLDLPYASTHHYLLDAGKSPYASGLAPLSAADCANTYRVNDNPGYRSLLQLSPTEASITASGSDSGSGGMARVRCDPALTPKGYCAVFDGASSKVGVLTPTRSLFGSGRLDSTPQHRYYLLGRRQSLVARDRCSAMAVFEIRFWDYALTTTQLRSQYDDLARRFAGNDYATWSQ